MDGARTRAQGRGEPEAAEKTEAAAGDTGGQRCVQVEQDRQARQGAGWIKRNMRHNETFKYAMMVAWTSGRVRRKQRDRMTHHKSMRAGRH